MRAGDLDQRITIRRAAITAAASAFNEPEEVWADLATVWAQAKDASAAESLRAAEVGAEITTRFTVRWSPTIAGIDPRDRVLWRGREHNITAVRDVGRRAWREIDAVARAERT
jgi:SPP1 family predicted phage head-tail adaptor